MSLRRGERARLEATRPTVTVDQPVATAAGRADASAVVAVSREYRALGRELRPGPEDHAPLAARSAGGVGLSTPPRDPLVLLLIRVWQVTAERIGPLWTNILSVGFGRGTGVVAAGPGAG